jgi:hypothetical protein
MTRHYLAAIFALFPSLSGAQPITASVQPPGTYDDDKTLKLIADGAPRPLVKLEVPDSAKQVLSAQQQPVQKNP